MGAYYTLDSCNEVHTGKGILEQSAYGKHFIFKKCVELVLKQSPKNTFLVRQNSIILFHAPQCIKTFCKASAYTNVTSFALCVYKIGFFLGGLLK
jgi:hypothetical protein